MRRIARIGSAAAAAALTTGALLASPAAAAPLALVPTSTAMIMSSSTVAFADEHNVVFFASVVSATGTPTGTVWIEALTGRSPGLLCEITLVNGSGSCSMPANATLFAGSYSVRGQFIQNSVFAVSASNPVPFTVTP